MYWSSYVRYENSVEDESGHGPVDRHPSSVVSLDTIGS